MAQPALDYFIRRGFYIKKEVTEGVDPTPSPSVNGVNLFNGSVTTAFDKVERNIDRTFFGGKAFSIGNERAIVKGDFELYPPVTPGAVGTSSIDNEVLLLIGGMTVVKDAVGKTTTYNPISDAIPSAAGYWHQSGRKKIVLGGRADISYVGMVVGDRFKATLNFQGSYAASDAVLPVITTPGTVPAVIRKSNTTTKVSADGGSTWLTVWAKELSIAFGSKLTTSEFTSHLQNGITDRNPTFKLRIARTAASDFDPDALRSAGTIINAKITQAAPGTLTSELGIRGQIETINEVDIDGYFGWELTGPCVPSSAGGDEFYIQFADTAP